VNSNVTPVVQLHVDAFHNVLRQADRDGHAGAGSRRVHLVAVYRSTDVDRPRNLARSATVELQL